MKKNLPVVRIDRGHWLNQSVIKAVKAKTGMEMQSCLRSTTAGLQCCLGFACRQLGNRRIADLVEVGMPSDLHWSDEKFDRVKGIIEAEQQAAKYNDKDMDSKERERVIARVMRRDAKVKVVFFGKQKDAIARAVKMIK